MSHSEYVVKYAKRLLASRNPSVEAQAIVYDIKNLRYESSGEIISLAEQRRILTDIYEYIQHINESGTGLKDFNNSAFLNAISHVSSQLR